MTQLKGNKKDVFHQRDDINPDIVIINTCGFIDKAKQESIDTILKHAKEKEDGIIKKLYVTGCLSERYKDDLKTDIPEVDGFYGTRDLPELLKNFEAKYMASLKLLTELTYTKYFKYIRTCKD